MPQTTTDIGIPYQNDGERLTHNFLKRLSTDYFHEREFLLLDDGLKNPDFIVIHPEIGIMIIEAKDWNLSKNSYTWIEQTKIEKKDLETGEVTIFSNDRDNPYLQSVKYLNSLLRKLNEWRTIEEINTNIFVSSVVCFPKISRQEFINSVDSNNILNNDQYRICLDFKLWIFKDDIDNNLFHPENLLKKISLMSAQGKNIRLNSYPHELIYSVIYYLIPPYRLVGMNINSLKKTRKQLKLLSDEQMRWVESQDRSQNYLLDLPGSGKTSALISKAIYMKQKGIFNKQLIVTYSENLKENLNNLLRTKIRDDKEISEISESINVLTTDELVELVYNKVKEEKSTDILDIINILEDDLDDVYGLKVFDSILIDEIQDFDNVHLSLLTTIVKGNNFFFVGDLSQKIYKRQPDLERLGFNIKKIELPKTYRMYRTPKNIAKIALKFLLQNDLIKNELENNGYSLNNVQYMNPLEVVPEMNRIINKNEIIEKIKGLNLKGYNNEQIMIITSSGKLEEVSGILEKNNILYEKEYKGSLDKLTLVDFENSKGLEKEVVIIYGIEDLYHRSNSEASFDSEPDKQNKQTYSVRKIYIALTRTLESLIVYYDETDSPFIKDLVQLNTTLTNQITR